MTNANKKKEEQLNMSYGKATHILKKKLLFEFAKKLNLTICFRCNQEIKDINEFSIEHKIAWLDSDNPIDAFFNLSNIAFSHLSCNCSYSKGNFMSGKHPSQWAYRNGCRCKGCKKIQKERIAKYRIKMQEQNSNL